MMELREQEGVTQTLAEKYKGTDYFDAARALDDIGEFIQMPGGFEVLIETQGDLVAAMTELDWNRDTVSKLDGLKNEFKGRVDDSKFRQNYSRGGSDVWWQSMAGEAIMMRLWSRQAPLFTGLENAVYEAKRDIESDRAGIDFIDIVEHEGKLILVCLQFKTSGLRLLGDLGMVDLNNLQGDTDAQVLEKYNLTDPKKQARVKHAAGKIFKQLKRELGDKAPEEMAVILVGLGVRSPAENFGGWKQLMIEAQSGHDLKLNFANKLDQILTNETDEETQPAQDRKWYDEVLGT